MSTFQKIIDGFRSLQLEDAPTGGVLIVYKNNQCVINSSIGQARDGVSWDANNLSLNFSTGKGILATLVHCLVSEGLLDYDTPIASYWSDFAVNGKHNITLRQVMSHQADLFAIDTLIEDIDTICDWDEMVRRIASMRPKPPVSRLNHHQQTLTYTTAYSALVYGWILGEVIMQVTALTLQQALDKYLCQPLQIQGEVYFGVPDEHVSEVAQPAYLFAGAKKRRRKPVLKPDSANTLAIYRDLPCYSIWQQKRQALQLDVAYNDNLTTTDINALYFNPALLNLLNYKSALMPNIKSSFDYYDNKVLQARIPAANCVASANALAKIYAMLANKGKFEGHELINPSVFKAMTQVYSDGMDAVMPADYPQSMRWRLGYHRVFAHSAKTDDAFGHIGYNGSMAWCDTARRLAVVYIHNFDTLMLNDIRQFAISEMVLSNEILSSNKV